MSRLENGLIPNRKETDMSEYTGI